MLSAWRWLFGLRLDDEAYVLAPDPWEMPFVAGVGLIGLGWALFIAVTGPPPVGEIVADRGIAATAIAALSLLWLLLMRGPSSVWIGSKRLFVPGRPPQRIRYGDVEAIVLDGEDKVSIRYRARLFGRWGMGCGVAKLRIRDRHAFMSGLLGAIERDQGREFTAQFRAR
jgi:hypothetical protein